MNGWDLTGILPAECNRAFVEGMDSFDRQIRGFASPGTILTGVESRHLITGADRTGMKSYSLPSGVAIPVERGPDMPEESLPPPWTVSA